MLENINPWNLNDKEWKRNRLQRWSKEIQPQLKYVSSFLYFLESYDLPFLKIYFLTGDIPNYDERWFNKLNFVSQQRSASLIGTPYQLPLLFKVWFYPEDNPDLFKSWCKESTSSDFEQYNHTASTLGVSCQLDDKELFAGRSYYLDRYLVPKTFADYIEGFDHIRSMSDDEKMKKALQFPRQRLRLLKDLIYCKKRCLHGRNSFIYAFSHELFIDLIQNVDIQMPAPHTASTTIQNLSWLMNDILHEEIAEFDATYPLAARLKAEMIELFDQGVTPELDILWAEAKKAPLVVN